MDIIYSKVACNFHFYVIPSNLDLVFSYWLFPGCLDHLCRGAKGVNPGAQLRIFIQILVDFHIKLNYDKPYKSTNRPRKIVGKNPYITAWPVIHGRVFTYTL